MKSIIYFTLTSLVILFFFSCAQDTVMLYHTEEEPVVPPPPVDVWLLSQIDYTKEGILPYTRPNQSFLYDDKDRINAFVNISTNQVTAIKYAVDSIVISKYAGAGNSRKYDTIHIILNTKKQIEYAIHTTYSKNINSEVAGQGNLTNYDSTVFVYNSGNYLDQMIHYKRNNNNNNIGWYISYQETFTVNDGNVTEMINNAGERYVYTYNDHNHAHESDFCDEMPRNVNTAYLKCWTLQLLPLISDYLGTKNRNNVSSVNIEYAEGVSVSSKYTSILYNYTYNENDLLNQAKMSGMIGINTPFDNSVMTFMHTKK